MIKESFNAHQWVLQTIEAGHDPIVVYAAHPPNDVTLKLKPLGLSRETIAEDLDVADNKERIRRYQLVFDELERLGRVRWPGQAH